MASLLISILRLGLQKQSLGVLQSGLRGPLFKNISFVLWKQLLTRTFVLSWCESLPRGLVPYCLFGSDLLVNRWYVMPYRVDVFITEFAVGFLSLSNTWGLFWVATGLEREEGQGVSGQAREVKWRRYSRGSPAGAAGTPPPPLPWSWRVTRLGNRTNGSGLIQVLRNGGPPPQAPSRERVRFVWLRL